MKPRFLLGSSNSRCSNISRIETKRCGEVSRSRLAEGMSKDHTYHVWNPSQLYSTQRISGLTTRVRAFGSKWDTPHSPSHRKMRNAYKRACEHALAEVERDKKSGKIALILATAILVITVFSDSCLGSVWNVFAVYTEIRSTTVCISFPRCTIIYSVPGVESNRDVWTHLGVFPNSFSSFWTVTFARLNEKYE